MLDQATTSPAEETEVFEHNIDPGYDNAIIAVERTCPCGKKFMPRPGRDQQCCSMACSALYRPGPNARKDEVGNKYNRLTVTHLATDEDKKNLSDAAKKRVYWMCKCDCGTENVLCWSGDLRYGSKKSCGCARTKVKATQQICEVCGKAFVMKLYKGRIGRACSNECKMQLEGLKHRGDYVGKKYNSLTVLSVDNTRTVKDENGHTVLYLNCKCDCGTELSVQARSLVDGQLSCGCHLREKADENAYMSSAKDLYRRYINNAKTRELTFDLTLEQFMDIAGKPCHYCGKEPHTDRNLAKTAPRKDLAFPATGVDRVDSFKGYSVDNCVPACTDCNRAKLQLSHDAFINLCKRIVAKHGA